MCLRGLLKIQFMHIVSFCIITYNNAGAAVFTTLQLGISAGITKIKMKI
jgi:hypothetical protein